MNDYRPGEQNGNFRDNRDRGTRGDPRRFHQKHFVIGDMVTIIDNRHEMYGKYGLVERINPAGQEWQLLIKIGPETYEAFFRQTRFCTRLSSNRFHGNFRPKGEYEDHYEHRDNRDNSDRRDNRNVSEDERVNRYIDPVDPKDPVDPNEKSLLEDDDPDDPSAEDENFGNR